jgi:hypothetical protein
MGVRKKPILNMSTEATRMLLKDLRNFKETGYNPWDKKKVGTKKHWESRANFRELAYGSFKLQSLKLAEIVRAQTPEAVKPKMIKKRKEKTVDGKIEVDLSKLSIPRITKKNLHDTQLMRHTQWETTYSFSLSWTAMLTTKAPTSLRSQRVERRSAGGAVCRRHHLMPSISWEVLALLLLWNFNLWMRTA